MKSFFRTAVVVLLVIALPRQVLADCDITVGDLVMAWVQNQAADRSRSLAIADYDARLFNYFLDGYEDLHVRLRDVSDALDSIDSHIQQSETAGMGDDVAQSVQRQNDSQQLLNQLFAVRRDLDTAFTRQKNLTTAPTYSKFTQQALDEVGRASVLNAFQEIGSAADQTLVAKYRFAVGVQISDQGQVSGDPAIAASPADAVATAIASAIPVALAVYAVARFIIFLFQEDECEKRLAQQRQEISDAFQLLPSKLMNSSDLYDLFMQKWAARTDQFADERKRIDAALDVLDRRWREAAALNAIRINAAQSVLTADKIQALSQKYGHDDTIAAMFSAEAIESLADQIAGFNTYLAKQETALISSCGDVNGYQMAENHLDSLDYAKAAYTVYRSQQSLAPLYDLLDTSVARLSAARVDATNRREGLAKISCGGAPNLKNAQLLKLAKSSTATAQKMRRVSSRRRSRKVTSTAALQFAKANNANGSGWQVCALITPDGQSYDCGGQGTPYGNSFNSTAGNPAIDILNGAGDGGYAKDNRQVSLEIASVDQNLQDRAKDLNARAGAAASALPTWLSRNGAALDSSVQIAEGKLNQESAARAQFVTQHAAAVAQSKAAVTDFLESPFTQEKIDSFLATVGGTDASLPSLPVSAITGDAPVLGGISAAERTYGELPELAREIQREREKITEELPAGDLASLALQDVDTAGQFAAVGTAASSVLTRELLKDSAAVRFFQEGRLKTLSVTTVDSDGALSRMSVMGPNSLPASSLLMRVRQFTGEEVAFQLQASGLRAALTPDSPNYAMRNQALGTAEAVNEKARSIFESGEVIEGECQLKLSRTLLDLVTTVAPGVGWARSIYETVTGRNLISGDPLDTMAYATAVVGAVTGGIGSDLGSGGKIIHAFEEISDARVANLAKEFGDDVIFIAEEAKNVLPQALQYTEHALDKVEGTLKLAEAEGEKIVEVGRAYYDSARIRYQQFADELKAGKIDSIPEGLDQFADHTGLAYVSSLKTIRPSSDVDAVLAVIVNGQKEQIVTVYELESIASTSAVESIEVMGKINGQVVSFGQRFFPLGKP